jgi:hypothetical protein
MSIDGAVTQFHCNIGDFVTEAKGTMKHFSQPNSLIVIRNLHIVNRNLLPENLLRVTSLVHREEKIHQRVMPVI